MPLKFRDIYQETSIRLARLEESGHHVTRIWECAIAKEMTVSPLLSSYFQSEDMLRRYKYPLNPADAVSVTQWW